MILVVVGSMPFERLIRAMDAYAANVTERVVMQLATTCYKPQHAEWYRYLDNIGEWYSQASVVVTHAGIGIVSELLTAGSAFVVIPRRKHLGEHFDDHQWEFATKTAVSLPCCVVDDVKELATAISQAVFRRRQMTYLSTRRQLIAGLREILVATTR